MRRRVTVKVGPLQKEHRFPLDTPPDEIRAWKITAKAQLLDELSDLPALPADQIAVLIEKALKKTNRSDASHLKAWLPLIGHLTKRELKAQHLQTALQVWAEKRPKTIRHRFRVLKTLLGSMPEIALPKIDEPRPVPVPLDVIQRVAESLRTGLITEKRHGPKKTRAPTHHAPSPIGYAWFLVRATTGQRPGQIARAKPADIDFGRRIWFVRPSKGGYAIPLPLNDDMVQAWTLFAKAEAWGQYDSRAFSRLLRRHGWPRELSPYALRATFAIDLLLAGVPMHDVQGLLGHKQITTTQRHYAGILLARLQAAVGQRSILPASGGTITPRNTEEKPGANQKQRREKQEGAKRGK